MASHNWLIHRVNRRTVERRAPLCRGELLDVGCGTKPYEEILGPYVSSYVGLDHPSTMHDRDKVDIWAEATSLPLCDASFDTVVLFQTLEHIPEPATAISEAHRVLRPGGLLFITTPFMWGIHEAPRDFYRYTPFALTYLLDRAGFSEISVEPVGGYWLTAGLRFSYYLERHSTRWRKPLLAPLQVAAQLVAAFLNQLDGEHCDATGYTTLARRPLVSA